MCPVDIWRNINAFIIAEVFNAGFVKDFLFIRNEMSDSFLCVRLLLAVFVTY